MEFIQILVVEANSREEATKEFTSGEYIEKHDLSERTMTIDAAINVLAAYQKDKEIDPEIRNLALLMAKVIAGAFGTMNKWMQDLSAEECDQVNELLMSHFPFNDGFDDVTYAVNKWAHQYDEPAQQIPRIPLLPLDEIKEFVPKQFRKPVVKEEEPTKTPLDLAYDKLLASFRKDIQERGYATKSTVNGNDSGWSINEHQAMMRMYRKNPDGLLVTYMVNYGVHDWTVVVK